MQVINYVNELIQAVHKFYDNFSSKASNKFSHTSIMYIEIMKVKVSNDDKVSHLKKI